MLTIDRAIGLGFLQVCFCARLSASPAWLNSASNKYRPEVPKMATNRISAPYFINPASLGWNARYGYVRCLTRKESEYLTLSRYIWFGSNLILFIFTYFYIPETRDRTLEEIHEMFQAKLPARKFKGYVCSATEAMGHAGAEKDETAQEVENAAQVGSTTTANSNVRSDQV
jgi:hypothetical protein